MRTRKNPCPAEKTWLENHKSQECEREADPDGSSQINGVCPEESVDGELKKSRNGKKQRKRKRSPKSRSGGDSRPEFLLGMAAERVWFDKPLYDRAENIYREKLLDSWSGEAPGSPQIPEEFPTDSGVKSNPAIPKIKAFPRCSHGNFSACHHVIHGVWINKPDFDKAEGTFMEKSQLFPPPAFLVIPSPGWNSGLGTPDEGYGTALPTPAIPSSAIPAFPGSERAPVNGKPQIPNWEALVAAEAWLEKPLYDSAERNFYERIFSRNSQRENDQENPKKSGKRGEIPGIPEDIPACFFLHRDSESIWLHKLSYDRAESRFFSMEASRAARIRESLLGNPSLPIPAPGMKKMALDHFLHDKVWLEKHKYDDAERRFYERLNGPLGGSSRPQENGASTILRDIARARENIQKSLEGQKTPAPPAPAALPAAPAAPSVPGSREAPSGRSRKRPGRSCSSGGAAGTSGDQNELLARISHLEVENQNLHTVVADLQMAIFKLESRLNALEKSSSGSHQPSPVPPTQKVEPFSVPSKKVELPAKKPEPAVAAADADDADDDIDLFGSDEEEEEDEEAAKVRAERLRQYAEKKAKKPGMVAKSSILLDVKPWDDETDMGQLEERVRSIRMDGLLWGASKLVPVGYGIRKLQIQCVLEDEKVGTDSLEEEITKFEDYVQSVDIAAFNKI